MVHESLDLLFVFDFLANLLLEFGAHFLCDLIE